jgi:hypothetical protein
VSTGYTSRSVLHVRVVATHQRARASSSVWTDHGEITIEVGSAVKEWPLRVQYPRRLRLDRLGPTPFAPTSKRVLDGHSSEQPSTNLAALGKLFSLYSPRCFLVLPTGPMATKEYARFHRHCSSPAILASLYEVRLPWRQANFLEFVSSAYPALHMGESYCSCWFMTPSSGVLQAPTAHQPLIVAGNEFQRRLPESTCLSSCVFRALCD